MRCGRTPKRDRVDPSFEVFYRDHRQKIARTLGSSLGDQELGGEAADEAMSRAFQRWQTVSTYSNPEGWVFRTGKNWAISALRRTSKGRDKTQLLAASQLCNDQRSDSDLERAVSCLAEDHRRVVVLRFYADWTIGQIARELGVPTGTVKSRLSRALNTLRKDQDVLLGAGFGLVG